MVSLRRGRQRERISTKGSPRTPRGPRIRSGVPQVYCLASMLRHYHFAMSNYDEQFCLGSSSLAPSGERSQWRLVWGAEVPPKMKHFTWQVSSGLLPTNAEKSRRHLGSNGYCRLCGREKESTFHSLIACPNAANLWGAMQIH